MSEALNNSHDKANNRGDGNDPLEYVFDPSNSGTPSLRPPKLSEAGLQAAIQVGFSETYLPSSVTGADRNSSGSERSNNRQHAASMSGNHSNSNYNNHAMSGPQNSSPLFVDNYNVGLTDQQLEGLLAPLRHPDVNQVPPDVLANLLKSTRFEEIIIPTQRNRLAENANNQQRNLPEGANSIGGSPGSFTNSNNSAATPPRSRMSAQQTREQEIKSNLSPLAREFVPTTFQSSPMNRRQEKETADLAYAMSQVQFQEQQYQQHDSLQSLTDEFEGPDCILSTITDMISQVSQDPASLNRCTKTSVEVLKKYLNDEDTLGIVVTLLTEQMISNDNFCYSGAKILEAFQKNEIGFEKKGIKPLLLNRMKEEFDHCLNNVGDPEVRLRAVGVLRLLSELYMNFGVLADNSKLKIFALAVLELMQKLLQKDDSLQSVRCVCQNLKLIGWELQNSKDEKVQTYFGLVIEELKRIRASKDIHPSCVSLIDMILKLHASKWNREQEMSSAPPSYSSATSSYYTQSSAHPVYELPESDDDFSDDGAIMIDDEPEDVQAAYEEFLKMSSKSKQ